MSATPFLPGQCWVSSTEAELGLGIVIEAAHRRVDVHFPAAGETRSYAMANAPLSRVRYRPGQQVADFEQQSGTVIAVDETRGLLTYTLRDQSGRERQLAEAHLNPFIQMNHPRDRLFAGHIDNNRAFSLRCQTLEALRRQQLSPVRGLLGPRVQLLPHQLYIAHEVSQRYAPRVLLADEVGLGKTIEAGMIIHQQLISGRAQRVLILVPDSLLHQWLIEMLRRFNLHFTVLDQERCDADQAAGNANPFAMTQLALVQMSLVVNNPERRAQVIAAGWDMLVVDEAHHLHWTEQGAGPEYLAVAAIARSTPGLLLLTATPEQLGVAGHFARLQLLDPERFPDLAGFIAQEQGYQQLNGLLEAVAACDDHATLAGNGLVQPLTELLQEELPEILGLPWPQAQARLQRALLDRHGTGRVLFRNTRDSVPGFPQRKLQCYLLDVPEGMAAKASRDWLKPEQVFGTDWLQQDARVSWLRAWLKERRTEKTLLICADADTAQALETWLRLREGVNSAVFHEGMTLIARDRAAAYFADPEQGAQLLVCSEIGSEGRNFQFCHHLVLFDLPENPDLLEQRIGRLDRIGQRETVCIHVPCYRGTAQQRLLDWLHQGLNAFEQSVAWGGALFEQQQSILAEVLDAPADDELAAGLIAHAKLQVSDLRERLQKGRNRLLELNSCPPEKSAWVVEQLVADEQRHLLSQLMEQILDQYGVEQDHHSAQSTVLRPGEHMVSESFPGLPEEGTTVTFNRELALSREDIEYLTWEHPMVSAALDWVINGELGNASVSSMVLPPLKPGTLIIEAIFLLRCPAPKGLQLHRYLPITPIRCVMDSKGNDLTGVLSVERLDRLCRDMPRRAAQELLRHGQAPIESLLEQAERQVGLQLQPMVDQALASMREEQGQEIQRLKALSRINPLVRSDELAYHEGLAEKISRAIAEASLQMDCVRVIFVTD